MPRGVETTRIQTRTHTYQIGVLVMPRGVETTRIQTRTHTYHIGGGVLVMPRGVAGWVELV